MFWLSQSLFQIRKLLSVNLSGNKGEGLNTHTHTHIHTHTHTHTPIGFSLPECVSVRLSGQWRRITPRSSMCRWFKATGAIWWIKAKIVQTSHHSFTQPLFLLNYKTVISFLSLTFPRHSLSLSLPFYVWFPVRLLPFLLTPLFFLSFFLSFSPSPSFVLRSAA